jgi:hypothetical protein
MRSFNCAGCGRRFAKDIKSIGDISIEFDLLSIKLDICSDCFNKAGKSQKPIVSLSLSETACYEEKEI